MSEPSGPAPSTRTIVLALLAVYVLWGSTYLAMRIGVRSVPPMWLAGTRFLLAGFALYLWLRARGAERPTGAEWKAGAWVGFLLLVVGNGAVVVSQQWVSSGLAAVMVAMVPLWAALFGGLWGEWPGLREWAGLLLGMAGIVLMNLTGELRANTLGAGLLVLAPLAWALGSVWSRRLPMAKGAMASATQMLTAGVLMLAFGVFFEPLPTVDVAGVGAVLYLAVFGSIIAFSAYGYLLRTVRPSLATSYAYVNPMVAIALGLAFGGERLEPMTLVGSAVVFAGVVIVVLGKGRAQPSGGASAASSRAQMSSPGPSPSR